MNGKLNLTEFESNELVNYGLKDENAHLFGCEIIQFNGGFLVYDPNPHTENSYLAAFDPEAENPVVFYATGMDKEAASLLAKCIPSLGELTPNKLEVLAMDTGKLVPFNTLGVSKFAQNPEDAKLHEEVVGYFAEKSQLPPGLTEDHALYGFNGRETVFLNPDDNWSRGGSKQKGALVTSSGHQAQHEVSQDYK